jgi:hypothetical protein
VTPFVRPGGSRPIADVSGFGQVLDYLVSPLSASSLDSSSLMSQHRIDGFGVHVPRLLDTTHFSFVRRGSAMSAIKPHIKLYIRAWIS